MGWYGGAVSHPAQRDRLRLSDRIFFVMVNLHRTQAPFSATEYEQVASAMGESRCARQRTGQALPAANGLCPLAAVISGLTKRAHGTKTVPWLARLVTAPDGFPEGQ